MASLGGRTDERRLGCGMHIRSRFHAALLAKDRRAAIPLLIFDRFLARVFQHFADRVS